MPIGVSCDYSTPLNNLFNKPFFVGKSCAVWEKSCLFAAVNIKNAEKMEARTMTYPQEGMLLVRVNDMSMMKDIRKAISMVKGVENATVIDALFTTNATPHFNL